ncbi:class A beta-lactamase, subclass A2 [Chryseobacterium sp. POL2]|uniref:class A beta-lactamase, subclass A2 n=1 Tax=Chryseobacterium sp. POL2 TaxID=2713414 RepID=UPI0013E0F516|nr:class A beta-lactamase, subclass A2 [Chryseobacterium sp. POL2]QIG88460.1 class A beta-lactamase, subclass A2 [Chryseobacterium sp. POL2]
MNKLKYIVFAVAVCGFGIKSFAQQDLKTSIQTILKDKKANVGVAVWHLEKQDTLSVNGHRHLPMQSVFKLPIGLAVLDLVDKGKFKIDQKIKFTKAEMMPVTHSPMRDAYPEGGALTVREMLKYVVANSDNNTCDILLDRIGGPEVVQKYMDKIGIKDFQIVSNERIMHETPSFQYQNYWNANSANDLLNKLYTKPILKEASKKEIIKILEETNTGLNRLKAELPVGTIVAHKTGSSATENGKTAATNDIGVITLPNKEHMIVSVFVSDSYENDATNEKIIADIAKASFDYYSK